MTGWRDVTLGDVCELKRGYDLPKAKRKAGNVPIISSSGLTGFHSAAMVRAPGVVTGRYGTLGEVFYVTEDFWPLNTSLYVRDFKGNDPRWVAALLESMNLGQHDGAAAVPGLNRNQLHGVPVRVPDRATQVVTSAILNALDGLIENNRRRVEVLEEMSRSIYREWFVHFRYPDRENVALVESAAGLIPKGWRLTEFGEVAVADKGLSYKGAYLTEAGTPMANLKCFRPGGGFRRDGTKPYSGPFKAKHKVRPGDLILANTDLTQAGSVIGSPAIVPRRGFQAGGIISHHLFAIRCADPARRVYLYEAMRDQAFRDYARSVASGTTVLGLRPADLLAYQLLLPPADLVARFAELAGDIAALVEELHDSTEVLTESRDMLLPKLVSGQIDVSALDLDALVESSVA